MPRDAFIVDLTDASSSPPCLTYSHALANMQNGGVRAHRQLTCTPRDGASTEPVNPYSPLPADSEFVRPHRLLAQTRPTETARGGGGEGGFPTCPTCPPSRRCGLCGFLLNASGSALCVVAETMRRAPPRSRPAAAHAHARTFTAIAAGTRTRARSRVSKRRGARPPQADASTQLLGVVWRRCFEERRCSPTRCTLRATPSPPTTPTLLREPYGLALAHGRLFVAEMGGRLQARAPHHTAPHRRPRSAPPRTAAHRRPRSGPVPRWRTARAPPTLPC